MLNTERETEERVCNTHPTGSHFKNSFKMFTDIKNKLVVCKGEDGIASLGLTVANYCIENG